MQTLPKNKKGAKSLEKQKRADPSLKRGRPSLEPTKVMRVPISIVDKVEFMITKAKAKWL
jgi:hypothetical protein